MPRIRTVKPEMAQDEDLAQCSVLAQLLAVRILCQADDEGYFKSHPQLILANCFPLLEDVDSVSTHGALIELYKHGYLWLGEGTDGKRYGKVRGFTNHQVISRPSPSKFKDLVDTTVPFSEDSMSAPRRKGKERKGKERNGKERYMGSNEKTNEDFERIWLKRPKRGGGDPKKAALKAFDARIKQGAKIQDIEAGVERYFRYIEATGKADTEFVQRFSTFLGPNENYLEPWEAPKKSLSKMEQSIEDAIAMGEEDNPLASSIIEGELE